MCGQFRCVDRFLVYPELDGSDQEVRSPEPLGPESCLAMWVAPEHRGVWFPNHSLVLGPEGPEAPELKVRCESRCSLFPDSLLETRPVAWVPELLGLFVEFLGISLGAEFGKRFVGVAVELQEVRLVLIAEVLLEQYGFRLS